jgi:hypothetical protein
MRVFRAVLALCGFAAAFAFVGGAAARAHHHATKGRPALIRPTISDWQYMGADPTPPTQTACNNATTPGGRRCFDPAAMANSYDYASLHSAGNEGQGKTIA